MKKVSSIVIYGGSFNSRQEKNHNKLGVRLRVTIFALYKGDTS